MRSGNVYNLFPLDSRVIYSFQKVISIPSTITLPTSNLAFVTNSYSKTIPSTTISPFKNSTTASIAALGEILSPL
jgi:hypothetical protein